MNSMTGYGRGEAPADNPTCVVECTSVNRKTLEVSCQLPREFLSYEIPIREAVAKKVSRGRVNVSLQLSGIASEVAPQVDLALARQVARDLMRMKSELALSGSLDVSTMLQVPGIIRTGRPASVDLLPMVQEALAKALEALCAMRATEGHVLSADLKQRFDHLRRTVESVKALAPGIVVTYRDALSNRLKSANLETVIDPSRLAVEIALFAERSDVTEEITRLLSHLDQCAEKLASSEPCGRALEFLTQEIGRELNTLGAKAGDAALSRIVVDARVDLDKIREQISNLE